MLPLQLLSLATVTSAVQNSTLPNIIFVMADDLGFNDVGYSDPTVHSPVIDGLAAEGVKLSAMYTWNWCAPSRGAMLSGRYAPFNGYEDGGDGPKPDGKKEGSIQVFPLAYKLLPQMLKEGAGYRTMMTGKWHLGYATPMHVPEQRGFDEYLGYLTGAEDYFMHTKSVMPQCPNTSDLWRGVNHDNGTCTSRPESAKKYFPQYSAFIFTDFLVTEIGKHAANHNADPLFVYAAYQSVHGPLEVPQRFFDIYKSQGAESGACLFKDNDKGFKCDTPDGYERGSNCYCNRLMVKAQVSALDEAVGNVTAALRLNGMWHNSVFVFMGDNGGPTFEGHSNYPLRGGKLNFFEGGVRPASFVSSPLLPASVRGTWYYGMGHETDWVPTFLGLANISTPEGIDGVDFWPSLINPPSTLSSSSPTYSPSFLSSAASASPALLSPSSLSSSSAPAQPHRTEVLIADHILRVGDWKYVAGADNSTWEHGFLKDCMLGTDGGWLNVPTDPTNNSNLCPVDVYTRSPSKGKPATAYIGCPMDSDLGVHVVTGKEDLWLCSNPCTDETPCLWNLATDPAERNEVSAENPTIVASMKARLLVLSANFKAGDVLQGSNDVFCDQVKERKGFLGPWIPNNTTTATTFH